MAEGRKDANFSQGWGIAGFVTALVVLAFVVAGTINRRTFMPPTDPLTPNAARAETHGAAGENKGDVLAPAPEAGSKH
ncbi:MAG: hypothetical protein ABIT38_17585 [Gemmatimonadaceae bacterium]